MVLHLGHVSFILYILLIDSYSSFAFELSETYVQSGRAWHSKCHMIHAQYILTEFHLPFDLLI